MITVTVFRKAGEFSGFTASGHAGYAESGNDILCAAVSVLTIHTANAIENIAGDKVVSEESDGFLRCSFPEGLSHDGSVLMEAMTASIRQVEEISDRSGKSYVRLITREV